MILTLNQQLINIRRQKSKNNRALVLGYLDCEEATHLPTEIVLHNLDHDLLIEDHVEKRLLVASAALAADGKSSARFRSFEQTRGKRQEKD